MTPTSAVMKGDSATRLISLVTENVFNDPYQSPLGSLRRGDSILCGGGVGSGCAPGQPRGVRGSATRTGSGAGQG
ncbi:hypothetical protein BN874_1560007 [Candidatus Contendobacter odensis Run_B_J11]|uniref:Uncharacterized protein n=1 Tax=Candidatus Contendobacter odensis Run_B_J11 TaxID=1400861 RepID=A0A7U7G9L8_9GAMM|nr:hypothetical protein BN874_1560007 [Candidatus Contendobacter odensis Run_B_J11]